MTIDDIRTPEGLKAARLELRMTQAELAEALGMKRLAVARMETRAAVIEKRTAMAVRLLLSEWRGRP